MPFFDRTASLVPDLSLQQILLYRQLLRQKAELTRQIQRLLGSVPMVPRPAWHCQRCGHDWSGYFPRKQPKFCSRCMSPYWNRPRSERYLQSQARALRIRAASQGVPMVASATLPLPSSLRSLGMTPPPGYAESMMDSELDEIAATIAAVNRAPFTPRKETLASTLPPVQEPVEEPVEDVPSETPPEPLPPDDQTAGIESVQEGPKCCSKPLWVDGLCLNCGAGLGQGDEKRYGHLAQ
jgi:hypothetical protein